MHELNINWSEVCACIALRLSKETVEYWLGDVESVILDDRVIVFCKDDFRADIVRRRLSEYILYALKELYGQSLRLEVRTATDSKQVT